MRPYLGTVAILMGALLLSACGSDAPPPPPPAPVVVARAAPAPAPRPPVDQCGIGELRALVGRPKTEIPIPLDPSNRRVVCTTCPMTEEYMPRRQTILFDADTGLITEARCG
jgi:hypothetical protein